ncbi:PorV/PorQ family protein [Lutimonas zeaxanthinifaciens]|uniref:putative type IX sorting system protein PorV2 n=1 Tax=Lutimonas zeaxanthinifaciens TaxID=3060215 RepID=UPI00265CE135|nr:PorV/PorQ family protein [Lutimonas sp. YSD2104]WKK67375.1 PorV/PorQ family protein [Lutimonas sp. YSD2104]
MKLKKGVFLIVLLSSLSHGQAFRSFSNEFLNLGVDAAAFGMGKAVIASSGDVNSIYWNPAGLTKVDDIQGALMHAEYFQGIGKYDYAAFAKPINDVSTFAVAFIRFGVDDILNTTELIDSQGNINYDNISLFSAADYAFNVAYARRLPVQGLNLGVNTKIVHRKIGDFASSWGFGIDASLQFQTETEWRFGVMVRDITTTFNAWTIDQEEFDKIQNAIPGENQEAPETLELTKPKVQFGVAKSFVAFRDFNILTEIDLNMRFSETNDIISSSALSIDPGVGLQFDYLKMAYLRVGVNNFQYFTDFEGNRSSSVEPNFGVGFRYKGIQLDYALANIGAASGTLYSNIFSIKVDISYFR